MQHRRWLALLLATAFAFAGCARGVPPSQPGTLRIIMSVEPSTLNPVLQHDQMESFLDGLIFDELVTRDDRGHDVPDLAAVVPTLANGGVSEDGLTITYHLRRDVRWQDGARCTSADVKFTWQAIENARNLVLSRQGYDEISSISTPDAYTVVLHMKRRYAPIVETFLSEGAAPYRVLPAHLLAGYASLNDVAFNAAPVGTGPYRVVSWQRGDRIVLAANPRYFRGAPHIARIVLLFVPDHGSLESMMESGEADLAIEVTPLDYEVLAHRPGLEERLVEAPEWLGIAFNTAHAPLSDVRVRRAIARTIDDAKIVRTTSYGTSTRAVADLTPFSWAFDANLAPTPYDPESAAPVLRALPRSERSLEFAYPSGSATSLEVAEEVQRDLEAAGIALDVKAYLAAQLYEPGSEGGVLDGGMYDLALIVWNLGADPDDSALWLCSSAAPRGSNITRYCSRSMDAAQAVALSTFDRARRKEAYARIERLLLRDVPVAFVADLPMLYVYRTNVRNFAPNGISEGWNAARWELTQSRAR